tara:strand:+ start:532 stop:810 length:279 start_codon:yes stop_codon:yes gene_type:complete
MNNNVIECKLCNEKMMEFESNNPQPLLENFEDRVCRDCNDFVTASRILLRGIEPKDSHEWVCAIVAGVIQMGNSLKQSRLKAFEQLKELKER